MFDKLTVMQLSRCLQLATVLFSTLAAADRELLATTDVGQTSIDWLAALGTGSAPLDLSDPRVAANTTATDAEQVVIWTPEHALEGAQTGSSFADTD